MSRLSASGPHRSSLRRRLRPRENAATLLRGARACLALLAAAALLALAAPAQAQTEIWSATLTPGDLRLSILGCGNHIDSARCSSTTVLSEDSFNYDSTDYTITMLFVRSGRRFELQVDADITTNTNALTLVVGSTSLVLAEATTSTARLRTWDNSGVSMTAGTDIAVKLTAPNAATGAPSISGTATVGHLLTATAGTIADADGLPASFTYQWVRVDADGTSNEADITGANSSTYTLADDDEGKKIKVKVSFTDNGGNSEMRTSGAYPTSGTVQASSTPGSAALVSNVGQTTNGLTGLVQFDLAQSFTTGTNATGYTLTSIELRLNSIQSSDTPTVKLYRGSAIGTEVDTLSGPAMLDATGTNNYTFTPSSTVTLLMSTTYWVVAEANTGNARWLSTGTGEDATPATDWGIGDRRELRAASFTDGFSPEFGFVFQIRVNGTLGGIVISSDATLSALALEDASDDSAIAISPAFASGMTSYTASVDNDVDEITIKPTVNESSATVEYLNSFDTEITDADSGKTGQQVSLSVGANTIKVKVTAEDTTTMDTYTVVVTRAAAAANTAPTGADKTVTIGSDTAFAFTADDFGFADTDTGDTLASVKIERLPAVGTLALAGTDVSLNDVIPSADIGDLTFTPVTGGSGDNYASFTFKVNDGTDFSVSANTITFNVRDLSCAAPDFAGDGRRELWTGIVTVGDISSMGYGFNSDLSQGELDDTTFAIGRNSYTVDHAFVLSVNLVGRLSFSLTGGSLLDGLTAGEEAALRLHVCDTTVYDFSATSEFTGDTNTFKWDGSLDWSPPVATRTLYLSLPANHDAMGAPTITGTAQAGQELTADVTGVTDADGLTGDLSGFVDNSNLGGVEYSYQWIQVDADGASNPSDIPAAEASTYTLTADDVGKKVKVKVSFTDDLNGKEERTSAAYPAASATVTAANTTAPALISVTVTSTPHKTSDTYGAREHIEFSMTFDKPVTVTGAPTFAFDLGGATTATWYAGSGTATLRFSHAVTGGASGDRDTNGISWAANAIALNGGTIAGTGNAVAAILTHVAQSNLIGHKVDGRTTPVTPATVTDVEVTSRPTLTAAGSTTQDTYGLGETIVITVTVNESVTVEGDPEFRFSLSSTNGPVNDVPAMYDRARSSSRAIAFVYTVLAGDRDNDGIWIGTHSQTFKLDANDRIRTTSRNIDLDRSHPEKGTQSGHKVDGSRSAPTRRLTPPNTAPVVANPLADQEVMVGVPFTYVIPADAFTDADGNPLAYTAALSDGGRLPGWLTFDPATRTFTGTPGPGDGGTVRVTVMVSDGTATVSDEFALMVTVRNTAPVVANPLADQEVMIDVPFTYVVPADAFTDADGDPLAYTAATRDGGMLPSWLTFDAATRTFTGTPASSDSGPVFVTVTASDGTATVSDEFALRVLMVAPSTLRAWTSRFGRTVATHVTDAVGERLRASPEQDSQVTVGGYRLPLGRQAAGGADPETTTEPETATDRLASLLTGLVGRALGLGPVHPQGTGTDPWAEQPAADPRLGQSQTQHLPTVRLRDVLLGSSFRLNLGDDAAAPGHLRLTAWGRVAGTQFSGRDGALTLDGDVLTGTVGVDSAWDRWLAGVAVSHSLGGGSFTGDGDGDLDSSTLTSIHPYLRYAVNERVDVWSVLGYGWGDMTLEPGTGGTLETDTTLLMGSFGGRGILLPAPDNAGFQLATRMDAMLTRTTSGAVAGLAETEADAHRLRLVLEGTRPVLWPEGQSVTPAVELGVRHDWGDAETGFGLELGGRVQYADPNLGLTIEAAVRGLLTHEDSDYKEWGASGTIRIAPDPNGQGLSLTLSPTWGASSSGIESLWSRQTTAGLAPQGTRQSPTARLNAEIGYGLPAPLGPGLLTPYAGTVLTDGQAHSYRLGTRWTSVSGLTLNVEGTRQDQAGQQPPTQGLQFQATWGF